jgi:hydroxypyruvate reductase
VVRRKDPRKNSVASKSPAVWQTVIDAALRSADPKKLIHRYVRLKREILSVGRAKYNLKNGRAVHVIGAGKASASMAAALEEIMGGRITTGLVVVPYGYGEKTGRVRIYEAGHPIPDRAGLIAARKLLRLIEKTKQRDLIITLWSGGASALLPLPVKGVSLNDKKRVTHLLLKSGTTILEMNAVRKHLSRIKGGQLARSLYPRKVVSLILSDVNENRLDVIASGPTVPDPTRYGDAIRVLKRRRVWDRTPKKIRSHLESGARGNVPETPKRGDPEMGRARNLVIGGNRLALDAAARQAANQGFHVWVLPGFIEGEAKKIAAQFVKLARKIHRTGRPVAKPACVIGGGETTVNVRGPGRGGRCQEFVLAAVNGIKNLKRTVILAFGTDGVDGAQPRSRRQGASLPVAGAIADDTTSMRAGVIRLAPQRFLANNDSYSFFKTVGGQIVTGRTNTNVNDLYLMFVF